MITYSYNDGVLKILICAILCNATFVVGDLQAGLRSDFNNDGAVDFLDFGYFAEDWRERDSAEVLNYELLRFNSQVPVHIELMDDIGSWSTDNCLKEVERDHVLYFDSLQQSVKLTTTDANEMMSILKTVESPLNVAGCDIVISFYIPPDSQEAIRQLYLVLGTEGWESFVGFQIYLRMPIGSSWKGWHEYCISPSSWEYIRGDAQATMSSVKYLRLRTIQNDGEEAEIVWDSIRFIPKRQTTCVVLTFDDGFATDWKVAEYLHQKKLRACFFVCPGLIGGLRLSLEQLHQMQQMGHLIANHTWSHQTLLGEDPVDPCDDTSPLEYYRQIDEATNWMISNGFNRGSRIFAVPGGTSQSHGWIHDYRTVYDHCDIMRHTASMPREAGVYSSQSLYTTFFDDVEKANMFIEPKYWTTGNIYIEGWHSWSHVVTDAQGDLTEEFKEHIDKLSDIVKNEKIYNITLDEIAYGKR